MQYQGSVLVQQIALTMADGSCRVMAFVVDDRRGLVQAPTPENIERVIAKASESWVKEDSHLLPVASWRLIQDYVPTDRAYNGARIDTGTAIEHDMAKAREVHLAILRAKRTTELIALDTDWMRATGQVKPTEVDAIEAQRQALRDMPVDLAPQIEAAQTIDELKAIKLPTDIPPQIEAMQMLDDLKFKPPE